MDKLCPQARLEKDLEAFGGMSVILVEDHAQLGPVIDSPLFVSQTSKSRDLKCSMRCICSNPLMKSSS